MKMYILCKNENNFNGDSNNDLIINCGICKGMDTSTPIKIMMNEYYDEIEEIVYPECDILKKVLSRYNLLQK